MVSKAEGNDERARVCPTTSPSVTSKPGKAGGKRTIEKAVKRRRGKPHLSVGRYRPGMQNQLVGLQVALLKGLLVQRGLGVRAAPYLAARFPEMIRAAASAAFTSAARSVRRNGKITVGKRRTGPPVANVRARRHARRFALHAARRVRLANRAMPTARKPAIT